MSDLRQPLLPVGNHDEDGEDEKSNDVNNVNVRPLNIQGTALRLEAIAHDNNDIVDEVSESFNIPRTPSYMNPNSPSSRGLHEPDLDSYDYNNHGSLTQRIAYRQRTHSYFKWRALQRWILTAVVAMMTALVALVIWYLSRILTRHKFMLVQYYVSTGAVWTPALILICITSIFVLCALWGVAFVEPVAVGSGIPQIKCILNGLKIPRVVRIKTLFVKALGVAFAVSGGLPIGIEGPMIHSGAILGAGLSQGKTRAFGFDTSFSKFRAFRNDREKRDFVAAGAAAGVSCAFGAPIGGVLFALEEGSSWWSQKLTWRTFFCSMFAYFVLAMFTSGLKDHSSWGHLSDVSMFTFGSFTDVGQNHFTYAAYELPFFVLIGSVGGLAGGAYNAVNTALTKFRQRSVSTPMRKIFEGILTVAVINVISFLVPLLLRHQCLPLSAEKRHDVRELLVQFYCANDYYNPAASLFLAPMDDAIKVMFHSDIDFSYTLCFTLFFIVFWTSCWCYGLSVPSGLFVPTLFAGAGFGRIIGQFLKYNLSLKTVEPGTYALLGAAAVLGGMARMTISLTVILIEATGDIQYGLPIMVALMTSKWVGDFFTHGLYDIHIDLNGWQFLEYDPPKVAQYLLAADIMNPNVKCVYEVERAGCLIDLLNTSKHHGFPVVQRSSNNAAVGGRRLCGLILRKQLSLLLNSRAFFAQRPVPFESEPMLSEAQMEADYPHYPDTSTLNLSAEEREMFVDLTPYLAAAPYTVNTVAPVTLVFRLYRTMGLRHIPVVTKSNEVVGMITRKDLTSLRFRRQLIAIIEQSDDRDDTLRRIDDITRYSFVHNYLDNDEQH